jgi:Flp pilus assembly protein TadD
MARKAIALEDAYALPYISLGRILVGVGRYDEAVAEAEKAVRVEPGDARAQAYHGYFLARAGRAEEGIAPIELAMRWAPFHPGIHTFAGVTYFLAGRYGEAVAHFERRESIQSRSTDAREALRAAAEVLTGRPDAARDTVEKLLKDSPGFTIRDAVRINATKRPEDGERLAAALRQTQLPE